MWAVGCSWPIGPQPRHDRLQSLSIINFLTVKSYARRLECTTPPSLMRCLRTWAILSILSPLLDSGAYVVQRDISIAARRRRCTCPGRSRRS